MTVTKRVITKAERQAATVAAIAARVAERWPKVESVAAALSAPTMRANAPHDGGRSGHSDPTATIALGHPGYDDLRDAVEAWVEQGKWIEQRQIEYLKEHPELARQKRDNLKALCSEAGCDFDSVRRGMCWHHYELALTAERAADQAYHTATTPGCDIIAIGYPSAQTSSKASVWCSDCRESHDVPTGDDPAEWLAAHRLIQHEASPRTS